MLQKILIFSTILILLACQVNGYDKYKKYEISSNENYLIKVSFSDGQTILTLYGEKENETLVFDRDDVAFKDDTVFVKEIPVLCSQGFFSPDGLLTTKEISKVKMETDQSGKIEIFLTKKSEKASAFVRSRSKNKFGLNQNITVDSEEFIRGSAISFWSNITIEGEVNGHVIAFFGDIDISDRAIIRGNVLAVNGNVNHAKNSTVYGEIRATNIKDKRRYTKTWRVNLNFRNLTSLAAFRYNRIDGAAPYLGYRYINSDSTLPELSVLAGYGFASKRWRYNIGLKQYLLKNKSLQIGGSFYKKLASHDDWIISENENTLFALFATEDYKDYYEAEGGYVFAKYKFPYNIDFEFGYQIENHKWLDAHKNLWSLAGGSKRFRDNFSTVTHFGYFFNTGYFINNMDFKSLIFKLAYNMNGKEQFPINSFFSFRTDLEITPFNGLRYYDYTLYRITAQATRYQTINRKSGLIIRLAYGTVGDNKTLPSPWDIPIYKLFYLGGLGTLRGYDHKEFYGTEFWLTNIEYRINFPAASWNTWLFYDAGQIGKLDRMNVTEVKNSVGIGLTFSDIIRINLAKRLDRSNDTVKLYVRMKHQF